MCYSSNLSLSKDGHGFDTSWIYDQWNTKPSVNTYTWTVTYQLGSRVEPGVYNALFVRGQNQVYQPAVVQKFKNAKFMRFE